MEQTGKQWLLAVPPFSGPRIDITTTGPVTRTSPYYPRQLPARHRPCMLKMHPALPENMIRDLPRVLENVHGGPSTATLQQWWENFNEESANATLYNEDNAKLHLRVVFLSFVTKLGRALRGEAVDPVSEIRIQDVNVQMDLVVNVADESRVAIEAKQDKILALHEHDFPRLAGIDWLEWNGKTIVEGPKSIIIKVCLGE